MCKARHVLVAVDATPLLGTPTGVGVFAAGLLGGLAARDDVDVSAFAISWRRRQGIAERVPPGVRTDQRAMPARPLHLAWKYADVPPLEWMIGTCDVVHGTNFVVPPTRRAGRVVTVHDVTVVRYPEMCDAPSLAYPGLIRRAIATGAWIHTPSEFVAHEVIEDFGADPARVRAIHHGVPALPPASDYRPPLPEGCHRYVLAVGTIEPRKDYPGLLAAFAELEMDDVALVIVGGDGWGSDEFAAALERSAVRHRVVRPGYVSDADLAALLTGAAALVYPSHYEGFGFPPLQAMAVGTPVVATDAGAIPEVVGDGALLVPRHDPSALAESLQGVLEHPDEALVVRGRARAASFTWQATAARMTELYADVRR